MKIVDTKEYLGVLSELIESGSIVNTVVSGNSMMPFLRNNRDFVILKKADCPIKKGDVVLFKRLTGSYIFHRVMKVDNDGYYLAGDCQTVLEGPIRKEQIIAVMISANRKGKLLTEKSFIWWFFSRVWIHTGRLRPYINRLMRL